MFQVSHLTNFMRHLLLWLASLPPFIRRPLALAMARLATWGSASGRDSKMTIRTPMGTVFWTTSRVLEILVLLTTLFTLSKLLSAICISPVLRDSSLARDRASLGREKNMKTK